MNISFYVLSESKAQDSLGFMCQLTQTALNKGTQALLILVTDEALLEALDEALWANDATSFIPHQRLMAQHLADGHLKENYVDDSHHPKGTEIAIAPVLLGAYLPADFNGIIINTTSHPITDFISATNNATPTRILELIYPDAASVQSGREKYKQYQQLGYKLTHFKV